MILSNEVVEEYTKVRAMHDFGLSPDAKPWVVQVTFEIKDGKAAEILEKVKEAFKGT